MAIVKSFNHDVNCLQDKGLKMLKVKEGLLGYAIFFRILEEIYSGTTGYYLEKTEEFDLLFCDDNKIDKDFYENVISTSIEKNLFDKEMFEDYKILTSKRIQSEFIKVVGDVNRIKNDYLLLEEKKKKIKKFDPYKEYSELYEKVYDLYPVNKRKRPGQINFHKRLEDYSGEELIRTVERYKKDIEKKGTSKKYIVMISNFFGRKGIFEDYVDSEYEEETNNGKEANNKKTKSSKKSEVERLYDGLRERKKNKNVKAINSDY
jgi:hypothetical protein